MFLFYTFKRKGEIPIFYFRLILVFIVIANSSVFASSVYNSIFTSKDSYIDSINSIYKNDTNRRQIYKYLLFSNPDSFDKTLYHIDKQNIPLYYLTIIKHLSSDINQNSSENYKLYKEVYFFNKRLLTISQIQFLFDKALQKNDRVVYEKVIEKSFVNEAQYRIKSQIRKGIVKNLNKISAKIKNPKIKYSMAMLLYGNGQKTKGDNLINEKYSKADARLYYKGKYHSLNSTKKAINYYKSNLKKMSSYKSRVIYDIARLYRKNKDYKTMYAYYDKLIKEYPTSSYSAKAIWYIAWEKEKAENYPEAIKLYSKLSKIKSSDLYIEGYFRKGLCEYIQGDYLKAISTWESVNNHRFYFWRAKAYEKANLPTRANSLYESAMKAGILNYYAIRSAQKLDKSFNFAKNQDFTVDQRNQNIIDIKFLDASNLSYFIRYLHKSLTLDEKRYIASYLYDNKNIEYGYMCISQIYYSALSKKKTPSLNDLKLMFPINYTDSALVFRHNFIELSLMKQESNYKESVVSPAGAIGLMQVMPSTGKLIAKKMGLQFHNDSLYNGDYNFKIGSKFIEDLLKQYNGNIIYTAASYNAGGGRVKRWKKRLDDYDDDLKVECIEFNETRNYLRAIYRNYYVYNTLYLKPVKDFNINLQPRF